MPALTLRKSDTDVRPESWGLAAALAPALASADDELCEGCVGDLLAKAGLVVAEDTRAGLTDEPGEPVVGDTATPARTGLLLLDDLPPARAAKPAAACSAAAEGGFDLMTVALPAAGVLPRWDADAAAAVLGVYDGATVVRTGIPLDAPLPTDKPVYLVECAVPPRADPEGLPDAT